MKKSITELLKDTAFVNNVDNWRCQQDEYAMLYNEIIDTTKSRITIAAIIRMVERLRECMLVENNIHIAGYTMDDVFTVINYERDQDKAVIA